MSLFDEKDLPLIHQEGKTEVFYFSSFYSLNEADRLFQIINSETEWKRETLVMFGKEILVPRDTCWYGEKTYTYSGIKNAPKALTPTLLSIKEDVEEKTNETYNSLLINRYILGNDSVDWHADDEPELCLKTGIASLSLGEERDFLMREKGTKGDNKKILLENGSLLQMKAPTQQFWEHSIPKRNSIKKPRINLTFRYVLG